MNKLKKLPITFLIVANIVVFGALVGVTPAVAAADGDDCGDGETTCDCLEAFPPWYPAGCYDNAGAGSFCETAEECTEHQS